MFAVDLIESAVVLLDVCRTRGLKITTAESCTGGLLSAVLTEVPGASDVFERSFITYSNASKTEMLGVQDAVIARHGAVSAAVAIAMTDGALKHAPVDIAIAVTGVAGPDGGTDQKPVGLVYIAVQRRNAPATAQRFHFTSGTRHGVRTDSVREALRLATEALTS